MTSISKSLEGRQRILECLAMCGAEQEPVILLDLQKQYFELHGDYLNKDVLRTFFGKGHIKQVFEQFMDADVQLTTNIQETGSLYIRMIRPLAEALAARPPVLAKNRVPMAEPKPAPVLVSLPRGGLPASKTVGTLKKSSKTASADSLLSDPKPKGSAPSAKGSQKMAASSTTNSTGAGNKYLDVEESGLKYGKAHFESKNVKTIKPFNVVKSKQPAAAAGLYSDSEEEKEEEELAAKNVQIGENLGGMEGEDDAFENNKDYGWAEVDGDEEGEDEYGDECLAQNDRMLKKSAAKMAAGEATVVVDKAKKQPGASSALQQGGPSNAIGSHFNKEYYLRILLEARRAKQQAALENAAKEDEEEEGDNGGGLAKKQLNEPKMMECGTNRNHQNALPKLSIFKKWATPKHIAIPEILKNSKNDEEEAGIEESMEIVMENDGEGVEVVGNNGNQQNGEHSANLNHAMQNKNFVLHPNASYGNARMPATGVHQQSEMPNTFKEQMLATITFLMKLESVYKARNLHAKLAASCYAAEYSLHFPTVDALVQFVRRNCHFVKVETFAGKNEVFLLETKANVELELDRLFQKVGKLVEAAANK